MNIINNIKIKEVLSDFIVTEVASLPSDITLLPRKKKNTIVKVKKSGFTTFEVIDLLSDKLSIDKENINCLGLKDEDGITEQFVSIVGIIDSTKIKQVCYVDKKLGYFIDLVIYGYSNERLVEKRLHGNIFRLVVRGLTKSQADLLNLSLNKDSSFCFVNYYDQQRFGLPGGPYLTHKIGKSLIDKKYSEAEKFYFKSGNHKLNTTGKKDKIDLIRDVSPRQIDFFVSAYTSFLWNETLATLIKNQSKKQVSVFDGYKLPVLDVIKETPQIMSIVGYGYSKKQGFYTYKKQRQTIVNTIIYTDKPDRDLLDITKFSIVMEFFLPTGSYATMAIKQLLVTRCMP